MSRSHISIIGAPLDLGQGRRGVDMGPSALRVANLNSRIASLGYTVEDRGNVPVEQAEALPKGHPHAKYLPQIAATCERLAIIVADTLVTVGLRDVDQTEKPHVRGFGVHAFTMRDLDERGMRSVMEEAIRLASAGTAGFHVSLDMDFVDPQHAPGVGTPVRGGVTYREAHLAMEMIADTESMVSLEVVEINPILDEHNRTALLGVELVLSGLGQKIL